MSNNDGHTALKDALDDFRKLLTPTEYSDLLRSSDLAASSVVDVTAALDRKKPKYGARRILPFLESVYQFSSIVDTFIQSNPMVSALVWGSIKFLIMVAMNFSSYFEKLAEMIEKLGFLCPVFDRIHKLYPDSVELCNSVCAFYATAITFCIDALKFFKTDGLRQFQKTLWRPFKLQFSDIERRLQEQSENIDRELAIASEIAACRERQVASLYRHQGHQHRELQLKHWEQSREWRVQQDFRQEKERRKRLLDKISDYDHTYSFLRARSLRHEGTGQWVAETAEFQGWYQETCSSGLWCHGIPGSGKTIMTTGIIDYIFSHRQQSSMICYFFCDFANHQSLEIQTVISSFIKQILNVFTIPPELEGKLEGLYEGVHCPPTVDQLFQILISTAQLPDITYFIVDGLDECNDNDKWRLLLHLKNLLRIRDRIKVLVSSRDEVEISQSLESFYKVSLDTPTTRSDIAVFVKAKLKDRVEEGSLILENSSMIGEIKETLVHKSEGMFLWVSLQLDDICKENNDDDIRQVLRSLPRGLNETYARILERIFKHRKPNVAKKILNWVAGARRPLHLDELLEAISFESGDTLWDQGRRRFPTSQARMLQNCGNLITLTHSEDGDVIQFVHYTAFEFLLSQSSEAVRLGFHIEMREANNLIGGICVTYLSLADFETQVTALPKKKAVDISPSGLIASMLPSVARRLWGFTVQHIWQETSQFDLGESLGPNTVIKPSDALKQKFRLLGYATEHWINHYSDLSPDHDRKAWRLFEDLIQSGRLPLPWESDDHSGNLPYATQFRWAVRNGHAGIFRLIMDRVKAAIEEYTKLDCGGGVTPIFLSCSLGHDNLVQILLDFGIDLHERSSYQTLLEVAAAGGHLAVVDRLLQAKADVNAPAAENDALQAAAEGGHLAVVDRLLQANADVNAPAAKYNGRTALQAATTGGHYNVVDRLRRADATK
ncbi:hypothetical protein K440DRAFT_660785 [Wilcoxina mikolae CBS 423.85]|nr:hypothetical protein K440DRAFT_660785 [Wilcoxina mikolae CBS 423.85]